MFGINNTQIILIPQNIPDNIIVKQWSHNETRWVVIPLMLAHHNE